MAYDRFLIAPMSEGKRTDLRPWQIPDNSFEMLENSYVFRGRVRKRFGSTLTGTGAITSQSAPLLSRARILVGTVQANQTCNGVVAGVIFGVGQQFSILDEIFTVSVVGLPAIMKTTGLTATHTFNTTTGAFAFTGIPVAAIGAPVYFYTSQPIMGLTLYQTPNINDNSAFAFDTQFSYQYAGGAWNRVGVGIWHGGSDKNFFWACNWEGANTSTVEMFVTNFNAVLTGAPGANDDPIWSYNPISGWRTFRPQFLTAGPGNYVQTARIIIPFKDRLVLLNTVEVDSTNTTNNHFPSRCRYSHNGVPFPAGPVPAGQTNVGVTDIAGDANIVQAGVNVGAIFTIGNSTFTVASVAPGPQAMTVTGIGAATYNSTTTTAIFLGAPVTTIVYYAPATTVIGGLTVVQAGVTLGSIFTIAGTTFTVVNIAAGPQAMVVSGTPGTGTYNSTTNTAIFVGATPSTVVYFFTTGSGAWLENNQPGWDGAGWIDAATDEEIVSAEFIKDRLIVYFESSTWELAYTGNQVQPFVWQKINTELGANATFSSVPFDKYILTVGNVGVHACTGGNVERIDAKIPQQIFEIRSENSGVYRVHGIRDYMTEMVYWTFPQVGNSKFSNKFPNKVLVYNYKNDTWALNDDCITCFSYFEQQDSKIWADSGFTWDGTVYTWISGVLQESAKRVLAGNQQGYIFCIDPDCARNAPVMQVTDIDVVGGTDTQLTIMSHSLQDDDYIYLENGLETGFIPLSITGAIYQVKIIDANTVSLGYVPFYSTYLGGASATRVSNINIKSKQWNPYIEGGRDVAIGKIDFCVQKTSYGQVSIDYAPSSSTISLLDDAISSGTLLGIGNILETSAYQHVALEQTQDRIWHSLYLQGQGECIQITIFMSDDQMVDPNISLSDFQLEGILLYCSPTGRLQ